jgi:hypothetical protein
VHIGQEIGIMRTAWTGGRRIGIVAAAVACAVLAAHQAAAFPQPNVVPSSWELDIKFDHPRVIVVQVPGQASPRVYWFVTYTVTNNSGADQNFIPELTLLTDAGDLLRANRNLPPAVYKAIREELRNPLLRSPTEVVGKLLQGPDNAVDGVAIWPMPDHDVDRVTIFFSGLSGETHEVENPVSKETVLLRKTLKLEYQTPGSVEQQPRKPWLFKGQEWVVR